MNRMFFCVAIFEEWKLGAGNWSVCAMYRNMIWSSVPQSMRMLVKICINNVGNYVLIFFF